MPGTRQSALWPSFANKNMMMRRRTGKKKKTTLSSFFFLSCSSTDFERWLCRPSPVASRRRRLDPYRKKPSRRAQNAKKTQETKKQTEKRPRKTPAPHKNKRARTPKPPLRLHLRFQFLSRRTRAQPSSSYSSIKKSLDPALPPPRRGGWCLIPSPCGSRGGGQCGARR